MREGAVGRTIVTVERVVGDDVLDELQAVIDSPSAEGAAVLVPFFGPTLAPGTDVTDTIGIDPSRGILAGIGYEWNRPFRRGETITAQVSFVDLTVQGAMQIGTVVTEYRDSDHNLIQRETVTFIERERT